MVCEIFFLLLTFTYRGGLCCFQRGRSCIGQLRRGCLRLRFESTSRPNHDPQNSKNTFWGDIACRGSSPGPLLNAGDFLDAPQPRWLVTLSRRVVLSFWTQRSIINVKHITHDAPPFCTWNDWNKTPFERRNGKRDVWAWGRVWWWCLFYPPISRQNRDHVFECMGVIWWYKCNVWQKMHVQHFFFIWTLQIAEIVLYSYSISLYCEQLHKLEGTKQLKWKCKCWSLYVMQTLVCFSWE